MTESNESTGKSKKLSASDEANSSLVGPEDPDRGPPPRYLDKVNQSECGEPTTSKTLKKTMNKKE